MALPTKVRKELQTRAHKLRPIVAIGINGLTEAVHKELNRALDDHELIKIRIGTTDRALKKQLFAELCTQNNAEPVQLIGSIGVIYRKNPEKV